MTNTNNLQLENIYKVIRFSLPISAGMLINMISSFIAMMMVAQLGETELAAGALGISTNITIVTIAATFFYSIGISISHLRGQQKSSEEIGTMVKNGMWLALLLAIPSSLILWNVDTVLIAFKQDPALIAIAKNYFHFAALSVLPSLLIVVFSQFFTGTDRPRYSMLISMISLPLIVFLSYLFVLGRFAMPQLGLAGITCATLISQTLISISVFFYLLLGKNNAKYKIFSGNFLPKLTICKHLFNLGFPIGVQFGAELAAMTVSTYFMGYFGVAALAASQIVSQYSMLVVMVTLGLSQALSVLISKAYGEKNYLLIKQYMFSSMFILTAFFMVVLLFFVGFPNLLIQSFLHHSNTINGDTFHLAVQFFVIAAITLFIDGLRNLYSGALRGLHDSKTPMHIGIICLWGISIPMNYLCGILLHGGPIGLRFGFMSGFVIAAWILWSRIKIKINLLDNPDLPIEFIKGLLASKHQDRSLAEPFKFEEGSN